MKKLPGAEKAELQELPQIKERISFLYLERCIINRQDSSISISDERGTVQVPAASLGILLLGPGTTITHRAMELIGDAGTGILWIGEHGVRYYAFGRPLTHSASLLLRQAKLVTNTKSRLAVARMMYQMRFGQEDVSQMTMQQRKAEEAAEAADSGRDKSYPDDYIVLDIETTGLREKTDEIMEIAMLKVIEGKTTASFHTLLHTKKPIPRPIEKLTGITNDDLAKKGKELDEILPQVVDFVEGYALVGHNIGFDLGFLNQALAKAKRAGLDNPQYDTMEMYTKVQSTLGKKSLADVVRALQISEKPSHWGMPDCKAEKEVYEILKAKCKKQQ